MSSKNEKEITKLSLEIKKKIAEAKQLHKKKKDTGSLMNEIWELSKKLYVLKTTSKQTFKKYDGIIFTVGFSHEPIILNILTNNPKGVFFIYTKESEKTLNRIIDETQLKAEQYKREIMEKNSFSSSMDLITVGLLYLNGEKGIKTSEIGLDITGGTKIMSAACGMAGLTLGTDILYVDNEEYDQDLRRPVPGSEVLKIISSPKEKIDELNKKIEDYRGSYI
ncbi:MAG: hypothetical protein ACFFAN_19425 [Promethearchaeota archaeon]